MRTREEITPTNSNWGLHPILEAVLDCRDLLQKLVDRKERTKTISAEIPLTEKEKQVLDSIEL